MSTSRTWQLEHDAAQRYERILVPAILGPAARALVDWSSLKPGETVLDAGCGTGAATRPAAERVGPSGRVIGADVNPGMIDVARSLPPVGGAEIEWRVESVYSLTMPDASVDAVLCAHTLQFLDRRHDALAEMGRVLRAGGQVTASCWLPAMENPYFAALFDAISRHVGPDIAAGLGAAFGLSDPDAVRDLFASADLHDVEVDVIELDLVLPPPDDFVPRHVSATPMAAGFSAAPDGARDAVIADVENALVPFSRGGAVRVPFRTLVARGVRA